jgi:Squalene-hopene cyclase C-terminal domain
MSGTGNQGQPPQPQRRPIPVTPIPVAANGLPPSSNTPLPVAAAPVPFAGMPMSALPVAAAPVPTVAPQGARPLAANIPIAAAPVTRPIPASAPVVSQPSSPGTKPVPASNRPIPATSVASPNRPIAVADAKPKSLIRAEEKDKKKEEEEGLDLLDEKKLGKRMTPLLISFIVHVVIILIMAFIIFSSRFKPPIEIEVIYAEDIGVQLENPTLDTGFQDPLTTDAAVSIDSIAVEDPLAAPPVVPDFIEAAGATATDFQAPSIGMALSGREKGAKKALLGAYGGTATTEAAVKMGLEWLAKQQQKDGTWSLTGPYANPALNENVTSATAMALLAFQGAGNTPEQGEFAKVVDKGWKALLAMQDKDGNFVRESPATQQLYAQAQATIAICELYAMTKNSKYAGPAELAIKYALKIQAPEGGWRYQPGSDTDTSVTGWFVMALQSARMAQLNVPQGSLDKVNQWLDFVASEDGSRYRYQRSKEPTPIMTAEALLCRQYLGWKRNDARLLSGCEYVLQYPVKYQDDGTDYSNNVYYWYYATQTLHHMEGDYWDRWNTVMRQAVPTQQIKTGTEKGSWAPGEDRWGSTAGRLYTTCLSIYMLEVYYRHLPIYANLKF